MHIIINMGTMCVIPFNRWLYSLPQRQINSTARQNILNRHTVSLRYAHHIKVAQESAQTYKRGSLYTIL